MNPITLPDDTSTEANVRDLLDIRDAGAQADSLLFNSLAAILALARERRDKHAAYQAILKADRYTRVLDNTMFARYGGYLDRFEVRDEKVTLYCTDSSQAGDYHDYTIPLAWVWASNAEVVAALDAQIGALIVKHNEARAAALVAAEAKEKATLAALLLKHGAPPVGPTERGQS